MEGNKTPTYLMKDRGTTEPEKTSGFLHLEL